MPAFAATIAMLPNPKPFFESLPDPRRTTQNKLHGLSDILSIALCAILSGMDDWEAVAEFLFDLDGVTVTIDAIGCQKTVARQITEGGGDYVLALKGNQSTLHDDVRLFMDTEAKHHPQGHAGAVEKDHGRIETRRIWVSDEIDWLAQKPDWPGLRTLVMVKSQRELNGQVSHERRCFITSHAADPERIGRYIRHHWRVENSLHWVLDMAFNEDPSRAGIGHAAQNPALTRRFALNLLRQARAPNSGSRISGCVLPMATPSGPRCCN
ncbi:ISAs1 family transposase [Marinobacterium aestuariivivens]|uniref:ISAs1 family transposase n=1 Tax=Marinobacterium aestuariivivens TaxID=1698799 RepID=A0ABW2A855_9GAMM